MDLYYESHGDPTNPTVLLIQGFTAQLVNWNPGLIDTYVERHLHVVMMDNRDVGMSGRHTGPEPYRFGDLANDVIAVADDLGLDTFHVLGCSMGGMVIQQVLMDHRERVASATLYFTTPSLAKEWRRDPDDDSGTTSGTAAEPTREQAIAKFVDRETMCGSRDYPFDRERARELGALTYDRGYSPEGWQRQAQAMAGFSADERLLNTVTVPCAIYHGTADRFFHQRAAIRLHEMLPTSELHIMPGLGHELVPPLWDFYADGLARLVRRAEYGPSYVALETVRTAHA